MWSTRQNYSRRHLRDYFSLPITSFPHVDDTITLIKVELTGVDPLRMGRQQRELYDLWRIGAPMCQTYWSILGYNNNNPLTSDAYGPINYGGLATQMGIGSVDELVAIGAPVVTRTQRLNNKDVDSEEPQMEPMYSVSMYFGPAAMNRQYEDLNSKVATIAWIDANIHAIPGPRVTIDAPPYNVKENTNNQSRIIQAGSPYFNIKSLTTMIIDAVYNWNRITWIKLMAYWSGWTFATRWIEVVNRRKGLPVALRGKMPSMEELEKLVNEQRKSSFGGNRSSKWKGKGARSGRRKNFPPSNRGFKNKKKTE